MLDAIIMVIKSEPYDARASRQVLDWKVLCFTTNANR
jgi:hypothetical protein